MSRALREVSLPALTTGVPLELFARIAKKRSFLIEILLVEGLDQGGRRKADKFWQGRNDGFRHEPRIVKIGRLVLAGAGGELARVFLAAPGRWVAGAATRMGFGTAALVAHLRGQATDSVFIE